MPPCMSKENNMCRGNNKNTTSFDEHSITQTHTLHVSLIQPEFNIDILQSLHVATPTYMFGTLGGNNHRGG